jgi:hypothetical protein
MTTTNNQIEFTRINNDVNGNPRYVCHFLNFIGIDEFNNIGTTNKDGSTISANEVCKYVHGMNLIDYQYSIALSRSRQLGGKRFHNKQYGGGIVFQMYSGEQQEMSNKIHEIANKYK